MGIREYDKIVVLKNIRDVLTELMDIENPDANSDDVVLTSENWENIQYAIKLIMDAYGMHINQENGILMKDDSKDILDDLKSNKYWWLDKFKVSFDPKKQRMVTSKNKKS